MEKPELETIFDNTHLSRAQFLSPSFLHIQGFSVCLKLSLDFEFICSYLSRSLSMYIFIFMSPLNYFIILTGET